MRKNTNIVIVMKSGGDFKMQDVYLLAAHINKYWRQEQSPNIYCYTDLVEKETSVVGLTMRSIPNPEWKGWWSKMNLFSPELKSLRPFLYLDIDTAVVGNVCSLLPTGKDENQFITLEDFYRKGKLASGILWVPATAYMDKIYKLWLKDVKGHIKKFRGDQNFIESVVKADSFWQKRFGADVVTTFKPNKIWRTELPENARVICFHGIPRIPIAAKTVEWVQKYVSYAI